ncbi:MAG: hypothetical protein ACP5N3_00565 [Candidatus Nanoarchaeia archaeon]
MTISAYNTPVLKKNPELNGYISSAKSVEYVGDDTTWINYCKDNLIDPSGFSPGQLGPNGFKLQRAEGILGGNANLANDAIEGVVDQIINQQSNK